MGIQLIYQSLKSLLPVLDSSKKQSPHQGAGGQQLNSDWLYAKPKLTIDSRSRYRHSRQIQGEVVGIALVHHFHTQVGTVDHISPARHHTTLRVSNGLVEVEPVQVERHRAHTQRCKPDTHHRPCRQEEVQTTRIVERSILEDQTTKVTVSGNNVVGLFLLPKLVTIVLGFFFGRLTNQRRSYQRTVHGREQRTTKHTSHTQHMEGVHQDIVLSLEHDHEVESTRNTQRHTIRERTLPDGVNHEYGSSGGNRSRVGYSDPRTHTQTVGQFPLTTHVAEYTDQEVENYQLVRTTVVQPLVEAVGFPNGVKVQANGVRRGDYGGRDQVVAVEQRARDRLTDTVNVHRGSGDEGDYKAGGSGEQAGDHQYAEPADV